MPSRICPPSTNPACSGEIISGRSGLRWLFITLEMILQIMLHKAIGLNLLGSSIPLSFGMRAKKVELRALRMLPNFLEPFTKAQIYSFNHSHPAWKNFVVKPFGPSALYLAIYLTAFSTSTISMAFLSIWLWSSMMSLGMWLKTSLWASSLSLSGSWRSLEK